LTTFPNGPSIPQRSASTLRRSSNSTTLIPNLTPQEDAGVRGYRPVARYRPPSAAHLAHRSAAARGDPLVYAANRPAPDLRQRFFRSPKTWDSDRQDMSTTLGFFLREYHLCNSGAVRSLAQSGAACRKLAPRSCCWLLFVLLRTAFLTTVETPEPRYVPGLLPGDHCHSRANLRAPVNPSHQVSGAADFPSHQSRITSLKTGCHSEARHRRAKNLNCKSVLGLQLNPPAAPDVS